MVYVALTLAVATVAVVVAFAGLVRSQQRAHARREDLLLNQLLHAAGKPWAPPPADTYAPPVEPEPRTWLMAPEQQPL